MWNINKKLRVTSHTCQGLWPCNCEGPWLSSKGCTICLDDMRPSGFASMKLWNVIYSSSCRNPCSLFQPWQFFVTLGFSLLVWSELGVYGSSWPMRYLIMQYSWALSLVHDVALMCLYSSRCGYYFHEFGAWYWRSLMKGIEDFNLEHCFETSNYTKYDI